jgi:glycosyltransferase involved in cell wall biosynthesis
MPDHLIISRAAVGSRMASPGIRAYQLAGALGRALPGKEITLAIPGSDDGIPAPAPNVRMQQWASNGDALKLAREHPTTISRNFQPHLLRLLGKRRFALDAYTPFYVEWMELSKNGMRGRRSWMSSNRWYLNLQLSMADYMFCADERQRDMWIGMLMALALVPPDMYERDPSLRSFIDVVPYGVSPAPLVHTRPVLRGVVEGIGEHDRILIWNGSITDWNDPFTLLEVMEHFATRRPEIKLVFLGVEHPDKVFDHTRGATQRAIELARERGLEGRNVFVLHGWRPYEEIDNYLAESDMAVCLGYEDIESRFAFRTRYVDVLRARLPLLCTRGDVLAERAAAEPFGIAVAERDLNGVIAGIERILDDAAFAETCRERAAAVGAELSWDEVVKPLVRFCESGESAAMPAARRVKQAWGRAGAYFALRELALVSPV